LSPEWLWSTENVEIGVLLRSVCRFDSRIVIALAAIVASVALCASPSGAHAQSVTHICDTATSHDNCERWYTEPGSVSLQWSWSAMGTLSSGCVNGSFNAEGVIQRSCTVVWPEGTSVTNPVWIGIDRTPPQVVSVQPDRPPDWNGWFNHPVGLTFQGADAISGVASCSSTAYGGPDGQGVMISGSCRDNAGHTGVGAHPINYDATPPAAPSIDALPGDHRVALEWSTSPDSQAELVRHNGDGGPVLLYRGPGASFTDRGLGNQRRYRYTVSLIDQAGNRASSLTSAVPTSSKLLLPAKGERIKIVRVPLLVWKPVRRANYYNVQMFRGRTKVLTTWPRQPRLQLKRRWRFGGRTYRLVPGKYCWYVWPGYGKRSKRDYGKRLGRSCFRIVR
jgi:hypothetical protein